METVHSLKKYFHFIKSGSCLKTTFWCLWEWGSWVPAGISIFGGSLGRMRWVESFFCVELHPWVSKVPFSLVQSQKQCSEGFRSKASVISLVSMLETGLVQHQASCSPLIHCVWGSVWLWATQENVRKRKGTKRVGDYISQIFRCLHWPHPFWPLTSIPRCD